MPDTFVVVATVLGLRSQYEYHPKVLNRELGRRSGPGRVKRRGELDPSLDDPTERQ